MSNIPDHTWFKQKFLSIGMSQREVAKRLEMSSSAIVMAMKGRRKFQPQELAELSRVLGEPIDEIMRRAGAGYAKADAPTAEVIGSVTTGGVVAKSSKPATVASPINAGSMRALRYATAGTADHSKNNWILFYQPVGDRVPPEAVGAMCIVTAQGSDVSLVRRVEKGVESGRWDLYGWDGDVYESNVTLQSASPIRWVRMP